MAVSSSGVETGLLTEDLLVPSSSGSLLILRNLPRNYMLWGNGKVMHNLPVRGEGLVSSWGPRSQW